MKNISHSPTVGRIRLKPNRVKPIRLVWLALPLVLLGLATGLCGCASVGHNFNNTAVQNLELGQMQSSEYRSVFGEKPAATSTTSTADGTFEVARYTYAYANLGSAKGRTLILEFKDGKLNAFEYLSSFDEDHKAIPFDQATRITNRVSTKSEVVNILGKPTGKALCPTTLDDYKGKCDKCVEVWSWQSMSSISTFGAAYGGARPTIQNVFIGFDKDGIVSEVTTGAVNSK